MKNIGIFHYKVGGTDGVSLEIDKWKQVLEEMGHKVFLCAGDLGAVQGTLIEEMYHHRTDAQRLYRNTFLALQDYDESVYKAELERLANNIEEKLRRFITEKKIDYLIPQNIWSVAANPAVALAMRRVMLGAHRRGSVNLRNGRGTGRQVFTTTRPVGKTRAD